MHHLVQLYKIKIIFGAVGAFVVELVHAHVLLLDFHGSIVEWVCGMLASGDSDDHIRGQDSSVRSFNTLWRYAENLTHELKFVFVCKSTLFY